MKKNYFKTLPEGSQTYCQRQKTKSGVKRTNSKQKKVKLKIKEATIDKKEKNTNYKVKRKNKTEVNSNNDYQSSDIEIVTGKGLSVPVCSGEEVVNASRLEKIQI